MYFVSKAIRDETMDIDQRNLASRILTNLPLSSSLSGASGFRAAGDCFMRRIQFHAPGDGGLAEQINRGTGFMQGARNLTWSFVAFRDAAMEREELY
jgi:GH15 family glucan-1,4-alpha-glucosidase